MLSKGKQITLGIFTVIGISALATLALGEIEIIDTIQFAEERPILLCVCYVLYFALFVIYAAIAKKKHLEPLAKTTIIFGLILAVTDLFSFLPDSALNLLFIIFAVVIYPVTYLLYPFIGAYSDMVDVLGMTVLFAAPIIAGIIYLFTKRPNKTEEPGTQVLAEKE